MSRYSEIETVFKDRGCLVKALFDVGYKDVEVHTEPQPLCGYQGDFRRQDDWNAHTTNPDLAVKAHVIVRRKFVGPAANDLGFVKKPDGTFSAIISAYDQGKHSEKWRQNLTHRYNLAVDKKLAKAMGYSVSEKIMPDGGVKLNLRR